ncbi:sigma-54 interaction domain-containing protein [Sutcliffiella cohnii]|uniref:sigma-54 interaction domain-containing protein n=1 Tax=Sutcliffiella cohnii TaxID=33932 RepID=UPI002E1D368B|nr:sigma 54-interacting transcriptional regulator [Sutcliffiella cohnii]MED4014628.1 sigma 54-interacting transcriptional regulator [Sutcliffiella cohnii]
MILNLKDKCKNNFLIVEEEQVDENSLRKLVEENETKKVFLQSSEGIFLVEFVLGNRHINYYRCLEVTGDLELDNFQSNNYQYILYKEEGALIGYVGYAELLMFLEREYKILNAFFESVLNTIDASCTAVNANQEVIVWTKGAEQIFSVKHEDIIGNPITDFFKEEHLELLNTLKNGTSIRQKQHQARDDLVVLINSNPVYLNNEIIGAVVSEMDITSQIKLHDELNNTREKLFELERESNLFNEDPFNVIRGNSSELKKTISMARRAVGTTANILIHGESGVGKELFAKAVHTLREGKEAPFIAINCGAIPSSLFESEMFGYERGAFSGADTRGKKGKIELAQGGSLFLDEIGEMPLEMQVKLLRLLQEKRYYPIGATKEREVDFRVIAATNRDLKQLVTEGKFREDLYYRLNVVSLEIPPLRRRREDIIELTHYFLYEISIKYNRPIHGISQEVMQALLNHNWQGNIRELKNVVERLIVFSEDGEIKLEHLPFELDTMQKSDIEHVDGRKDSRTLDERLKEAERKVLKMELEIEKGNKLAVANKLNITRATLYNRLKKLGIEY